MVSGMAATWVHMVVGEMVVGWVHWMVGWLVDSWASTMVVFEVGRTDVVVWAGCVVVWVSEALGLAVRMVD